MRQVVQERLSDAVGVREESTWPRVDGQRVHNESVSQCVPLLRRD